MARLTWGDADDQAASHEVTQHFEVAAKELLRVASALLHDYWKVAIRADSKMVSRTLSASSLDCARGIKGFQSSFL